MMGEGMIGSRYSLFRKVELGFGMGDTVLIAIVGIHIVEQLAIGCTGSEYVNSR